MAQELQIYYSPNPDCTNVYYLKNEVDIVLAEKDAAIAELKQKLEDAQASMYADVVDANMKNRYG